VSPTRNEIWNTSKVTGNTALIGLYESETDLGKEIVFNLLGDGKL
jgi:hypothetical protein